MAEDPKSPIRGLQAALRGTSKLSAPWPPSSPCLFFLIYHSSEHSPALKRGWGTGFSVKAHQAPRGENLEEEGKNRKRRGDGQRRGAGGCCMRRPGEGDHQVQKQAAEKPTPTSQASVGAETSQEARQTIRTEALCQIWRLKRSGGHGAAGDGHILPCVGEMMLASLSAASSSPEDQVLAQTWT